MKIALFVISNDFLIYNQIVKFLENIDQIGLRRDQVIIIKKHPRIYKQTTNSKLVIRIKNVLNRDLLQKIFYKFIDKPSIKKKWSELDVKIFEITNTNSEETCNILYNNQIDISIFIYYDQIVCEKILSINKLALNVHPALLPDFRGCQPLFWQIKNNQRLSALTLHRMTSGIDEGDIIFELPFLLNPQRSIYFNFIISLNNLHLLLLMGLRRLLSFDLNFGIDQQHYKGQNKYFSRPKDEDRL